MFKVNSRFASADRSGVLWVGVEGRVWLLRGAYLVGLEAFPLHAVLPEGQDTVLKAHCDRTQTSDESNQTPVKPVDYRLKDV